MNQKIKVLIDQTRLSTGHKSRGSGVYIQNLLNSLVKIPELEVVENISDSPDLVHFPYFDPFFLTLPSRFKFKTVITVHDLIPLDHPKYFPVGIRGKLKWQIQKNRLKQASAIITDSQYSKQRISVITKINRNKIFSIPLAAGPSFRPLSEAAQKKVKARYSLPEKFVLYLGDVNPNKNVPRLITASDKFNCPLILAGRPFSSDIDPIKQIKALLQTHHNAKILGEIDSGDDLVAIYNCAYLTVMPSWDEGFGFPILESMACGTPVAASGSSCLPEVGNQAAVYFDPYNTRSISSSVNKILSLPAGEYRDLVNKSLSNAKAFTWEKTAKLTFDAYLSIMSKNG